MNKRRFILYAIIKKDDGKYYVGQHTSTDKNPMSNYWGSGAVIKKAIAKHGKDAFERVILAEAPDAETLNFLEQTLVSDQLINDPMCYNVRPGGQTAYNGNGSNSDWLNSEEGKAHIERMCEASKQPDAIKRAVKSRKKTIAEHPEINTKRIENLKRTTQTEEYREQQRKKSVEFYNSKEGLELRNQRSIEMKNDAEAMKRASLLHTHISAEGRQRSAEHISTYAKEHHEETSIRMQSYVKTDEGKKHLSNMIEASRSVEARKKSSESHKSFYQTDEGKQQLEKAHAAAHTPEAIKKRVESFRKNYQNDPSAKERLSNRAKEIAKRPGQREKQRDAANNVYASERGDEVRRRISESLKKYYREKKANDDNK